MSEATFSKAKAVENSSVAPITDPIKFGSVFPSQFAFLQTGHDGREEGTSREGMEGVIPRD